MSLGLFRGRRAPGTGLAAPAGAAHDFNLEVDPLESSLIMHDLEEI
jgi:hypothetical protein